MRRNAAAFGGDPDNVLLFGRSGGGIAAAARLGCTEQVLDRMRALGAEQVLAEHNSFAAGATGGPLLPVDPATALADVSEVDVLSGHTSDESLPVAGLFELTQLDLSGKPAPLDGTPAWSPDTREALALGATTPTTQPWTEHNCDFWAPELR